MDKEVLGARIREQRKALNLTLEKFAEAVGIGLVYLGEIERGDKMPSITTFIKIVNNLGLSADYLLRDELVAAKPLVLNEVTEKMQDLTPPHLKMVKDVVVTMVDNFIAAQKAEVGQDDEG